MYKCKKAKCNDLFARFFKILQHLIKKVKNAQLLTTIFG